MVRTSGPEFAASYSRSVAFATHASYTNRLSVSPSPPRVLGHQAPALGRRVRPRTPYLFTQSSATAYSSLGRTKLTELVTSGSVPAARVGRRVLISRSGLDEYLRSNSYVEAGR